MINTINILENFISIIIIIILEVDFIGIKRTDFLRVLVIVQNSNNLVETYPFININPQTLPDNLIENTTHLGILLLLLLLILVIIG